MNWLDLGMLVLFGHGLVGSSLLFLWALGFQISPHPFLLAIPWIAALFVY
jgi:hypothetical protein